MGPDAEIGVAVGNGDNWVLPLSWNTRSDRTLQYASLNAEGFFWTYSWQVGARDPHEDADQACPAQAPQKVLSKTIC